MPWQACSGRVFCSQFPARWGTTRILRARRSRSATASPTDDAHLNTTRIYVDADACPVKDEIYRVAARHGLPVSVVAGQFHPGAAGSADRAHRGRFRDGCRRRLDRGTRRQRRYRHHLRYPAGEPLREGRRRGDRAERQAVYRTIDRHDAGGSQSDDRSALLGRSDRRSQIVRPARPLGVPVGARPDHPPHPAPAGRRSRRRNKS